MIDPYLFLFEIMIERHVMNDSHSALSQLAERIDAAAQRSQRTAESVQLIAVSKRKPIEDIIKAYEAGVRDFGENRAEELAEKVNALQHLTDIRWHFIGQLQSRQSQPVADHAYCFHAVDRIKIAERLSKQLTEKNKQLPVFIQVNISGEESKTGFDCSQWEEDSTQQQALLTAVAHILQLPALQVQGIMMMAPFNIPAEQIRTLFKRTYQLSQWLQQHYPDANIDKISMGMSGDFELAIEEGATHIRVGSAIFGARE